MGFMNEFDRADAVYRFTRAGMPNRLRAALVVDHLANWADYNSDGWAYWPKPSNAAKGLVALIQSNHQRGVGAQVRVDATDAELAAAMKPVKAFCTRQQREGRMTTDERDRILRGGEIL